MAFSKACHHKVNALAFDPRQNVGRIGVVDLASANERCRAYYLGSFALSEVERVNELRQRIMDIGVFWKDCVK
ncbi:hypothetical protein [Rhizobium sp. ARZ01]|uniref:hypothetical protein n=1 Tax=Rhizobium sp. ARZ01 TaxID=2769313 RepID=UPI001FEF30BD|nr:hypothetical protein [Rhizobium sp. ARZ01]